MLFSETSTMAPIRAGPVEGNAFGDSPATGKIGEQRDIQGHKTKGLVNTFMDGDNDLGTLTSPEFTVEHKFIKFLYGGAGPKGKAYIELLVDGSSVQKVLGDTGRQLKPTIFDLRDLQGKKAQVRIVDNRSGDVFGHVHGR
jgi:fructan beta-fructosidase